VAGAGRSGLLRLALLSGPPDGIIGLLAGKLDRPAATKVTVKGDRRKLAQLRPTLAL
jgi:hypothetical protein